MFIEAEPEMLILVQELLRKCSQEKGSERSRVGQGKKIKQEYSPGSDSIVVLYSTNCTRMDSTLKPFLSLSQSFIDQVEPASTPLENGQ